MNYKDLKVSLDETILRVQQEIKKSGYLNRSRNEMPLSVASIIDHTYLKPEADVNTIEKICAQAREYGFKAVCVNSANLPLVAEKLKGSPVLPITVVGFPLGAMLKEAKAFETRESVKRGAKEIDTVINVGQLKSSNYVEVLDDIKAVVEAAEGLPVKVIIETSLLDQREKIVASTLSVMGGARFVKTSTGFSGGGATVEDIKLIRATVGSAALIKASGGVKTYDDAVNMFLAGADRLGSSNGVAIISQQMESSK